MPRRRWRAGSWSGRRCRRTAPCAAAGRRPRRWRSDRGRRVTSERLPKSASASSKSSTPFTRSASEKIAVEVLLGLADVLVDDGRQVDRRTGRGRGRAATTSADIVLPVPESPANSAGDAAALGRAACRAPTRRGRAHDGARGLRAHAAGHLFAGQDQVVEADDGRDRAGRSARGRRRSARVRRHAGRRAVIGPPRSAACCRAESAARAICVGASRNCVVSAATSMPSASPVLEARTPPGDPLVGRGEPDLHQHGDGARVCRVPRARPVQHGRPAELGERAHCRSAARDEHVQRSDDETRATQAGLAARHSSRARRGRHREPPGAGRAPRRAPRARPAPRPRALRPSRRAARAGRRAASPGGARVRARRDHRRQRGPTPRAPAAAAHPGDRRRAGTSSRGRERADRASGTAARPPRSRAARRRSAERPAGGANGPVRREGARRPARARGRCSPCAGSRRRAGSRRAPRDAHRDRARARRATGRDRPARG